MQGKLVENYDPLTYFEAWIPNSIIPYWNNAGINK